MLTKDDILNYLKQNKDIFKTKYYIIKLGLFGSFAREQQTEKSDIDIIVVYEQNTENLWDIELEIKQAIEDRFNRKVDVCTEKWIRPVFKNFVMNEAIYV